MMSDHTVLGTGFRADISHHYFAGVDRDTHFDIGQAPLLIVVINRSHCQLHFKGACHGLLSVILGDHWCTKYGQDGVSQKFIDDTGVLLYQGRHDTEVVIQHFDAILWIQFLTQHAKAPDIRHHDGDLLLATTHLHSFIRFQYLLDYLI